MLTGVIVLTIALAGVWAPGAAAQGQHGQAISLRADPFVQDGVGGAPEVETEEATEVRRGSAILNGTVNPEGSRVTKCVFHYGTSPSFGKEAECAYLPGEGDAGIPVYAQLEGLEEHTAYYVELEAESKNGASTGKQERFATLPEEPRGNTEPASEIEEHSAKLNGIVNPDGAEVTECYFEYGPTKTYGKEIECRALPGSGETPVPVSAELEGLEKSHSYDYRLVAVNAYGEHYGGNEEFSTPPSGPKVRTEGAAPVRHTTAIVTGIINPNGEPVTECFFRYGTAKSYGQQVACTSLPGAGEAPVEVKAELTGLEEHTTYDYELVASNASASDVVGGNESLTTLPTAPRVLTRNAVEIGAESAVLRGNVTPNASTVTACEFEYGTTPTFGKSVVCSEMPGSGEEPVVVKASVTGLKPATTYYFRLHAENEYGGRYGGQNRLITSEAGLAAEITKVAPSKGAASGGTSVTISGANFSGATAVMFGSVEAKEFTAAADTIKAVSPPGTTGTVEITVTTPVGTSAPASKDHFTYGKPEITSFEPTTGPITGNTKVTLHGNGFATASGKTTVEFASAKATSVECSSSQSCTMLTPAVSKAGEVKVTVAVAGRSAATKKGKGFTYTG